MNDLIRIKGLIKRNILIFFNNKGLVFFSMLTPIIVLMLYLLFLKSEMTSSLERVANGLEGLVSTRDIDQLVNGLLLAGILGSALITIPCNALQIFVRDREENVDYDMISTPVKRIHIILGYYLASVIASFAQTTVVMLGGIGILYAQGDMYLQLSDIVYLIVAIFLGTISSTGFFMFIMMFFRNVTTSSAFMGILSAVAGFVIGAYIPLSEFNKSIQNICNLIPATGVTIIIRNLLTSGVLEHMDECIGGLDGGAFVSSMGEVFSFYTTIGSNSWTLMQTCVYIVVMTIIFVAAVGIIYPKVCKNR